MIRFRVLALAATALSTLAGCGNPSALEGRLDRPVIAAPEALRPCAAPVALPPRLTLDEVEHWWRVDRNALADCGERHAVLVGAISRRQ